MTLEEELQQTREVRQLMQMMELMLSAVQARFFLERMKKAEVHPTLESLFEIDGNLLSFSIAYGRLFVSAGPGRTILKPGVIFGDDTNLMEMHGEIMHFRHKKYAHSCNSMLPVSSGSFVEDGSELVLVPQVRFGIPLDSYDRYDPVLRHVDTYLFDKQRSLLSKASEKVGRKIVMATGPVPPWANQSAPVV